MKRPGDLFDGHYPPRKIRWWLSSVPGAWGDRAPYRHMDVLNAMVGGRSADETEMLSWCYDRVTGEGAGHPVTGQWCVCVSEDPPSACEARASVGGDGVGALIATVVDLEHAADVLPIGWTSTQHIYETQGRERQYRQKLADYRRNFAVRDEDRWLEPRDPETRRPQSRAMAHWLMARELGGVPDVCAWPRAGSLIERDVFTALAHELKEAA